MRQTCLVCGHQLSEPILHYSDLPSGAQQIPTKEELASDTGIEFNVRQCLSCETLQLDCEPVEYYRDVIRAMPVKGVFASLKLELFKDFARKFSLEGKHLIEVGCGKGDFIQLFSSQSIKITGIEHSSSSVLAAQSRGLDVIEGFVDSFESRAPNPPYDGFLSINFLEHQPDPCGMLAGIYNSLAPDGVGLITVPSFDHILRYNAYYEFIRDHLLYFTETTLRRMLETNGFDIIETDLFNEDTIYAYVKKRPVVALSGLANNYMKLRSELNTLIDGLKRQGRRVAIWGASHQGFTIIACAGIGEKIEYIIDSAEFKQGKYSPASHIEIVSPAEALSRAANAIIIAAPAYTKEILGVILSTYPADTHVSALRQDGIEILHQPEELH
jgi:SAM-dependent methyltransferase